MSQRETQVFDEYRFGPRSVLVPGDLFRVSGGTVYVTDEGILIPLYERGIFVFRRFCVRGAARWIEAYRQGIGTVILSVAKSRRRSAIPNIRRRPYCVLGKVSARKRNRV